MRFFHLILIFFLIGCGYRPSSQIAQTVLGDRVYVEVSISVQDAQNSVLVKDAIKEAIIGRLGRDVVPKFQAQTSIYARLGSVSFSPIIYDEDGYVIAYKTTASLIIRTVYSDGRSDTMSVSGHYDFDIEPNSVISDTKRYEAIKSASYEALDEYIAALSVKGLYNEHNESNH